MDNFEDAAIVDYRFDFDHVARDGTCLVQCAVKPSKNDVAFDRDANASHERLLFVRRGLQNAV